MVTMTDDIVTFIRARLDDAEQDADGIHRYEGGMSPLTCDHIVAAGHDACTCGVPAQLRDDIAAKRRILADYERYAAERRRAMGGWDSRELSPILASLALPYAGHPDYRAEWRP